MLSHELSCAAESFQPPSGKRQRPGLEHGPQVPGGGRRPARRQPARARAWSPRARHARTGRAGTPSSGSPSPARRPLTKPRSATAATSRPAQRAASSRASAAPAASPRRAKKLPGAPARRPLLAGQVARVPGAAQRRVEGVERRDLQAAGAGALRLGAHQAVAVGRVVGVAGEDRVERVGERRRPARRPTPRRRSGATYRSAVSAQLVSSSLVIRTVRPGRRGCS